MILSYKTEWPEFMPKGIAGSPTRFPQKIARAIPLGYWWDWENKELWEKYYSDDPILETDRPKKHTIRGDEKDRWKMGNKIHSFINSRQPNMLQIAPVIPCISVQKFEICDDEQGCEFWGMEPYFRVDGRGLGLFEAEGLAVNDGFDDLNAFLHWFPNDYTGKIIHWTHLKY